MGIFGDGLDLFPLVMMMDAVTLETGQV